MFDVKEKPEMVEKALLVRIIFNRTEEDESISLLAELEELVDTLGVEVGETMLVKSRSMHRKYLCGTGKAQEVVDYAISNDCDCIVFDNELAPSQQRNWEELAEICVIDREQVILDIFANRAQTKEATLQVDLAKMQYALPRMARMWGHLDREAGSSGGSGAASRGMGEQQIEIDRRLARKRIDRVKRELAEVRKQRATRRKERDKQETPSAAIVGYTNAGKSTLLNILANENILAKDMLFATLDTTTRQIELPDGQPLLLTDTVGFVRNLPHRLVEAFKATLEEAIVADFLIHVLDSSSPEALKFHETTMHVLKELGADEQPIITVLNKIDVIEDPAQLDILRSKFDNFVCMSLTQNTGVDELLAKCTEMMSERISKHTFKIPQTRGDLSAILHAECKVLSTEYVDNDIIMEALTPKAIKGKLKEYLIDKPV